MADNMTIEKICLVLDFANISFLDFSSTPRPHPTVFHSSNKREHWGFFNFLISKSNNKVGGLYGFNVTYQFQHVGIFMEIHLEVMYLYDVPSL